MKNCFLFLIFATLLLSCAPPDKKLVKSATETKTTNEPVSLFAVFVPNATTQPATYLNRLATIFLDKEEAYTTHSLACDHAALLSMFPDQTTKFYLINTTYTWLWGDGTSNYQAEATHTYSAAGKYSVVLQIEMSFRGGYKYRIRGELEIDVPNPLTNEIIQISGFPDNFAGTTETPPQTVVVNVTNTGGRTIIATPIITEGEGDVSSEWVSISPSKAIIINNSQPVIFNLLLDWPRATPGHVNISLDFELSYFTSAWHIPYVSGTLVPP